MFLTKLFKDKKILELFNTLESSNYGLDTDVQIQTLSDVLYSDKKNDLLCCTYDTFMLKYYTGRVIIMDNRLYNRRKELDLTLEQVGNICGVGKSTVRKWETGEINNMGSDKIILLAKALRVSPLFILQAESPERVLSIYDMKLLSYTDLLNNKGRAKVIEYASDLIANPLYAKDSLMPVAAHINENAATEDIEHDNRLMEDDSIWNV